MKVTGSDKCGASSTGEDDQGAEIGDSSVIKTWKGVQAPDKEVLSQSKLRLIPFCQVPGLVPPIAVPSSKGKKAMTLSGGMQQLLPGIPDDITFNHITTKLPWTACQILASVSCGWRHAIRSHEVHNARVRSHSTETLVLVNFRCQFFGEPRIALYSKRDNWSYELPLFPSLDGYIPRACQCIALDGKIYVLGGIPESFDVLESPADHGGNEVYVLDVFGQRVWERCSNMLAPRALFGCAAINGKIYVFGGSLRPAPVDGSEVYDPQENTWSPIKPMTSLRFGHYVVAMGEEMVVHDGMVLDLDYYNVEKMRRRDDGVRIFQYAKFLEIYDQVKDDWRVVESFDRETELLFLARGKFHSISALGIDVYDFDKKSWTSLHSFSLAAMGPVASIVFGVSTIQVVDNELLALVDWINQEEENCGSCLISSEGFGSKEIVWKKIEYPRAPGYWPLNRFRYFMSTIEL